MSRKRRQLRRIAQRDWKNGDCGIACVAMVTRRPYSTALRVFRSLPQKADSPTLYTLHKDLERMLRTLKHRSERGRFRSWRNIDQPAIVKVNARANGNWHWVVFDAGRSIATVHDPKPGKNYLITDFRGLKGIGEYLKVTPNNTPHRTRARASRFVNRRTARAGERGRYTA